MANGGSGRGGGSVVTPNAGGAVRQEYSGLELRQSAERAAIARAAHSEALVKSRVVLALQTPRDVDRARMAILKDSQRPVFAERAIYSKPVGGKKIEGPSVRLAESLARAWGNIFIETTITYEDAETRTVHVLVMDMEENVTSSGEIIIEKTVERRDARDRVVLSERMNSSGQKTYRVLATEDEILNKMNAAVSKMRRNKIIEMLPFDLVQEALDTCRETTRKADAKDPDAAKRRMLDAFAEIGVDVDDVKAYLGRSNLDALTPAELGDLRKAYAAIESEGSTWGQLMELREDQRKNKTTAPPPAATTAPAQTAATSSAPAGATPTGNAAPPQQPATAAASASGAPVAEQPAQTPPPRHQDTAPTADPLQQEVARAEAESAAQAQQSSPPQDGEDEIGNKLADDYVKRMHAAAEAGDSGKLIKEASAASKDPRIPASRKKPLADLFTELKKRIGQKKEEKGGT